MDTGDNVRYSTDFVQRHVAHDAAQQTGTIMAFRYFRSGVNMANVLWQDGSLSSTHTGNLEPYPPMYPAVGGTTPTQDEIQAERNLLIIEAWSNA